MWFHHGEQCIALSAWSPVSIIVGLANLQSARSVSNDSPLWPHCGPGQAKGGWLLLSQALLIRTHVAEVDGWLYFRYLCSRLTHPRSQCPWTEDPLRGKCEWSVEQHCPCVTTLILGRYALFALITYWCMRYLFAFLIFSCFFCF